MEFIFKENKNISVLSWLLILDRETGEITVEHGSHVETGGDFFVEGGWNGPFNEMNFDQSLFFCGTGGKIEEGTLILSTPNHPHERINGMEKENKLFFSNSLPFLLKRAGSTLSDRFYEYEASFQSILDGVKEYETTIPLADGEHFKQFYYCNILINQDFTVTKTPKNEDLHFSDYGDYMEKMYRNLTSFKENVIDEHRKQIRYELITTISKGYDAPACAALAKKIGCEVAVTFNEPNTDDCGTEIAEKLGYRTILEKNELTYLENKGCIEAEYISSGEMGTGIVFSAFDKEFKNKVVFMGERGDKIWSPYWQGVNDQFKILNEVFPSISLIETRLRVGYIFYPIPLFGAFRWTEIDRISRSYEMKPFRVEGEYDRPIPRRIVEEAGIPREMFGMKKWGAGFNYRYDSKGRVKRRMSAYTFQQFSKEYKSKFSLKKMGKTLRYYYMAKEHYLNFILSKLGTNYQLKPTEKRFSNPGVPRDLFLWSMTKMKEKY